jgi:hypothetical protein
LAKQKYSIDQPDCVGSVTFVSDRFQTCNFSVTGRISGGGELEKGFRLPLFALVFPLSARANFGRFRRMRNKQK